MKLSLCIATYNEEKFINYPLDSVYDLVDEVIIVDGSSTDKTVEIVKSYGDKVKVFVEDNPVMFHINKQKAIERAKGEWILQLDADEALSDELKREIINLIHRKSQIPSSKSQTNPKSKIQNFKQFSLENSNLDHSDLIENCSPREAGKLKIENLGNEVAYYIPRKNFFLNRFLEKGGIYPDYTIRLYKNGSVRFPCKNVHENVEIKNSLKIGYLKSPILHYESPTFSRYLTRWNRYTSLDAIQLAHQLNFFDYFFIKPSVWFMKTYFRHLGFKDGFPGFVFALFSSIRFWAVYVKWWQIRNKKETKL